MSIVWAGVFFPIKYQACFLKTIFLNVVLLLLKMFLKEKTGGQNIDHCQSRGSLYYSISVYV